jgi:hypothetical protein
VGVSLNSFCDVSLMMSLKEVCIFEIILRKIYMFEIFLKEICNKILLDFPLLISSSSVFCIGKVLDPMLPTK